MQRADDEEQEKHWRPVRWECCCLIWKREDSLSVAQLRLHQYLTHKSQQRDRSNTKYPYESENTKQNPQLFKLYNFNSNTKLKYRNIPDQNTQELF